MFFKKEIRELIFALFLLSAGGWLLHFYRHPIGGNPSHYVPFVLGFVNIIITPLLFNFRKTVIVGYLINGFTVILGTITMAHLSLTALPEPLTLSNILFRTTFAYILLLLPKLFIGQAILRYYFPTGVGRLFTAFWWARHFLYVIIIYSAGHFLWS